jgi:putative ABC transport system permease protein
MRGLNGLAWRGLRARPLRSILTTAGVALGVAVLFAGLATNTGIEAAVDRTVDGIVGRTDLRIEPFGEAGLSAATYDAVAAVPGVAVAAPTIERRTYLGLESFEPGAALPPPVTVVGIDPGRELRLHDLPLASGAMLADPEERSAVISATLARDDGMALGDRLQVEGLDGPTMFRVIGILAADGPWGDPSGRAVVVPLATTEASFGETGLSRIDLGLDPAADPAVVTAALEAALRAEPYVLSSPQDIATAMRASTGGFAGTTALIAAIALFAGAFLIFNSLSMTVVERVRELGLLRAAGATRGQLTSYILVQASVIGALGSVLGIVLGTVLATVMAAWIRTVGEVSLGGPVLTVGDAVGALVIGFIVTLAAAIEPARRAGRIAPVEALKARLDLPTARRARLRWLVAVFALVGGFGLLVWPRGTGTSSTSALVVYSVLLAVALAVPFVLPILVRVAGLPFALVARFEERIARVSVLRDRSRAALTVGALTIGLAMIVALGGVAQHARAAAGSWIADVVPGDLVVTSIFPRGLDEGIVELLEVAPGVATVSPIATFDMAVFGVRLDGAAVQGADLATDGRLVFTAGDRAAAFAALDRGGAVIVPAGIADRDDIGLGADLAVTAIDGTLETLRVVGIAERTLPGVSGESLLVGWSEAERLGVLGADAFAVRFEPTASAAERTALAGEARALALDPVALDQIQGAIGDALDRVFGLFDVLALVAVIVASLGIVNTLTMNVLERVREIGVLRAAGMTRRQVWGSVVVEAGITGLVGAICGVATGLVIGALMVVLAGGRWDLASGLSWPTVGLAFLLGVVLAMLAAAYPARLASGVSIVRAVGHE